MNLYDSIWSFFSKIFIGNIREKNGQGEIHHSGPHGGWCNQCLCQQTSFTRSYLSHQGMINLPPFETLGAILAPGELLGLHNSTLSGCFLNTSTSRFCLRQGNGETWRNMEKRNESHCVAAFSSEWYINILHYSVQRQNLYKDRKGRGWGRWGRWGRWNRGSSTKWERFYRFEESKTLQMKNLVFHTPVANM